MEEDEAKRKQAKHKGVFLRLGDDLAVDYRLHVAKLRRRAGSIESPRMEVADGFVQNSRTHPRRSSVLDIRQTAGGANP